MQLLSSDGQLFELSDAAARQSITLEHHAEDAGDGAPVPVPLLDSGRLQRITALLERTAAAFGLEAMADEARDALLKSGLPRGDMGAQLRAATAAALEGVDGVADFATLLLDVKYFHASLLTSVLAEGVARLLKGKSADALRTLLEANDDLGDREKEAALRRKRLFSPFSPPADAVPPPLTGVLLDMDGSADDEGNMMACLNRCDAQTLRQLKAVSAGLQYRARRVLWNRLLDMCPQRTDRGRPLCLFDVGELNVEKFPHEAVAAVRSLPNLALLRAYGFRVQLNGPEGVRQAALGGADRSGPLGGAALRRCIHEGDGEPPHELLLAAVACAARGEVCGVPVQQLREDNAIDSLNLDGRAKDKYGCTILADKHLGVIGAELLGLMLPAADSLRELNLGYNKLCGLYSEYKDRGDIRGTYTTLGITKLCEALKGSSVTSLDLSDNYIGEEGASALAAVIKETQITTLTVDGHALEIDKLKGTNPTEKLDLSFKGLGVASAIIIASCIKGNRVLKQLNLKGNGIGVGAAFPLASALKETIISNLNLSENRLGSESGRHGAAAGAALAEGLKGNTSLQSLYLNKNELGPKGGLAIAEGLKGNTALRFLYLKQNDLRNEAKQALKDAAGSSVRIRFF